MGNELSVALVALIACVLFSTVFYRVGFTSGQLDAKRDCDSFGAFIYDDRKYECSLEGAAQPLD